MAKTATVTKTKTATKAANDKKTRVSKPKAAVLYRNDEPPRTLQYHLGPLTRNTTFEAEAVGLALGLQLLSQARLPRKTTIAIDNQGVIQSTAVVRQRASHYHFDAIHQQARNIARKERGRNNFSLTINWISSHSGAEGNEAVDKAAKEAAQGNSSDLHLLPPYLRNALNGLPTSVSALKQLHNRHLKAKWKEKWTKSPRYEKYEKFKETFPFTDFRHTSRGFSRRQYSLIIQLRTGHAPLNRHLHTLTVIDSPHCPHCPGIDETLKHYLYDCQHHQHARIKLTTALGRDAHAPEALFGTRDGIIALLEYVNDTERFKETFGDVSPDLLRAFDDRNRPDPDPIYEWDDDYDMEDLYFPGV